MLNILKKPKGFTLIELVVVIAILGILAGIAIPRFLNAQASARGSKLLGDLRSIDSAISIYAAETGNYPTAMSQLVTTDPPSSDSRSLLAAIPVPPTYDSTMIILQNDGSTKEFTTSGTEYTIINGRATYTCTAEDGKDQPVEYYLGQSSATPGGGEGGIGEAIPPIINPNGVDVAVKLSDELNSFFADGWTTVVGSKEGTYVYKIYTVNGTNYAIALGDHQTNSSIKNHIIQNGTLNNGNIIVQNDGTWSDNTAKIIDSTGTVKNYKYTIDNNGKVTITDINI